MLKRQSLRGACATKQSQISWFTLKRDFRASLAMTYFFSNIEKPVLFRLFKKLHMQGVEEQGARRTLLYAAVSERQRQRRRWAFFNSLIKYLISFRPVQAAIEEKTWTGAGFFP